MTASDDLPKAKSSGVQFANEIAKWLQGSPATELITLSRGHLKSLEDAFLTNISTARETARPAITRRVSQANSLVHSIRIRHRDVKPHNILIKADRILLTDFGIALDWENLSRSTTTADSGKTWVHAAPEVARYEKRNTSADVWSLGCVFMELVTVLKGETIAAMRTFFEQQTGNYRFYANVKVLPQWAKHLRTRSSDKDDISFKWVRGMLEEDADDRSTAAMLYADIVEQCKLQSTPFCGSCCVEGSESSGAEDHDEEDPWEQDEDTTVVPQGG
ncbi:kinase-like domain-containing protein [Paraphoma chrysanthemicola]|uniref:Kinase-like domain-containing protein n=1 Tax=Paraphoma chrysanthemicola TaxID=798071 RepID=A0A8K0RA60_9PLEO|nr:kinase-like domain-containing protein [Paraphoma chrysanthemicola]